MRVLLIGDASNYHNALACGLRRQGCDVTVASAGGGFMKTANDIDLGRHLPGKAGGLLLYTRLIGPLRRKLSGFDIVSASSPGFVELRPERVARIFDHLKADNNKVFYTALGTDTPFVEDCLDPASPVRYNEFRQAGKPGPHALAHPEIIPAYTSGVLRDWHEEFYKNIDGAVTALYEYQLSCLRRLPADKVAYGGIPIDVDSLTPMELPQAPFPVKIFLGRHRTRQDIKGTDRFEIAIRQAMERHPGKGELIIVENRPYTEYLQLMRSAHLLVDQAYSYTPATNALLAMAYGIPTVSGAEPEYYDFIGQPATPGIRQAATGPDGIGYTPGQFDPLRPIYNSPIDIDGMTEMFSDILADPSSLRDRGIASRKFVMRHNAADIVAHRFLDFWQKH